VEIYGRVRRAVRVEGRSQRAVAREFGLSRETVQKMLQYAVPPGYQRQQPIKRPKLGPWVTHARQGESGGLKALYEELELVVRSIERIDEKLTELNRPPLPEVTLEQVREFVNSRIEDPEKLLFGAAESLKMNFLRRIIQIVVTPVEDEKERFFRITGDVDLFVARESVEQTNQVDLIGLLYTIPVAFEITRFRHQPKWALPLAA